MTSKQQLVGELMGELASVDVARQLTRRLATSHYENFLVASVLLPRRLRQSFFDVYAFCRIADDLADLSPSPAVALERLAQLRDHLGAMFDDVPTSNLFLALRQTVRQHDLPRSLLEQLIEAFEQDQSQFRYANLPDLLGYCAKSANPVGRLVLRMADCQNDQNDALSDKVCTGLQLANHWQDIAADFALGRIYVPQDAWASFGVSEEMFAADNAAEPFRQMLRQQCEVAESLLLDGLALAGQVPRWFAASVKLFAHGGLETIRAIRRIDFDVLARRPRVTRYRQALLVGRAAMGWL